MGKYFRNHSVSGTWIGCFVIRYILIDVPKEETEGSKTQVILLRNTLMQKNQKVGASVYLLIGKAVSVELA